MSEHAHESVMVNEVLESLVFEKDGLYVDCTLGAGGHSQKILEKLNEAGSLISFDKDAEATKNLSEKLSNDKRFRVVHDSFSQLGSYVKKESVQGILIDLGISSTQLDNPERGFSFQKEGPLDMRLDITKGISAEEWINTAHKSEIENVFWNLGEERFSRKIAKRICEVRSKETIKTTKDLTKIVLSCVPRRTKKHPATNIFRAIRMKLNKELEELYDVLEAASYALSYGGRLVVISFHSMEDRIVKRFIQGKDRIRTSVEFSFVGDKFIKPSLEEVRRNPRSRSAILRVEEKVA